MPEDYVIALLEKLQEHFTKRKKEIMSAIYQTISLGDRSEVVMLNSYIEHIDGEHLKLKNIKNPEAFASAVVDYLNRQYNLENQKSDQATAAQRPDQKLSDIKELQGLAVKIIKPTKAKL